MKISNELEHLLKKMKESEVNENKKDIEHTEIIKLLQEISIDVKEMKKVISG